MTRREFLKDAAVATALPGLTALERLPAAALDAESPRRGLAAIGLCKRYEYAEVRQVLASLLEELGDMRRLVKNKRVTVKTNLVNTSSEDVAGIPLWLTVTVHPAVALALGNLLVGYGARLVTFCDQLPFRSPDEEAFAGYGFDLERFNQAMAGKARFENTRNLGRHRRYAVVKVPDGGELASAWEVNRTYTDTDVLISLAKMKSHVSAGVTGGMKNLFGIPPSSLYGDDLKGEPDEEAIGYRSGTMHDCDRLPLTSSTYFTGRSVRGDHGHNVPRFIVDLNAAFPIDLVVIDGISTIQTAEGWWLGSMVSVTRPGVLIAGRNAVSADAAAAAVMGFDPEAADHSLPFANGANYLALARHRGLGENRIGNIEVAGTSIETARFQFQPTYRRGRS